MRRHLVIIVLALIPLCGVTIIGALAADSAPNEDELGFVRCDPTKVLGVDTCVKCHANEVQQWQQTPHYATFDTLHRKPEAKAIADKLGLRSVKRNDQCTKCHYTTQADEGRERIVAGVSCESCHGAARDWVEMHADYGGPTMTRESEPAEHRQARIDRSIAAGMNNPANLYLVARQCLACHTSPDERLVNVGGHASGSPDFELVAWSQGMVRHNFVHGGGVNALSSPERLRVMYVVGVLADLEASLRATAAATEKATFGVAAAKRAAQRKRDLYEISQLLDNPQVKLAMTAALGVRLQLNNREALLAAADVIGQAAFDFAENANGAELGAVDPLLPKQFK
jgi:hypothetical protein